MNCDLVAAVTAIACAIAKCLPKDELDLLIAVLGQLAATLGTIAVQEDISSKKAVPEPSPEAEPVTEIIAEAGNPSPSGNT